MITNQISRETLYSDLIEILSDLFDINPDEVDLNTSPDTIEAWDSIGHIRLISSIEEKYQISITPEDQIEMLNVDLVISFLADKLAT
tara:strand:+ start:2513 stop:2773 length:261 start_codon:yes stop_codon:yes gene_type:complete